MTIERETFAAHSGPYSVATAAGATPADILKAAPAIKDLKQLAANRIDADSRFYSKFGKRALDIVLVLLAAPVVLPVVVIAAMALWIESGLPFYQQQRRGQGGKSFGILKLRTMVRDADELLARVLEQDEELRREWVSTQKLKNDPRITPVGKVLRTTSLDELPQLWNVLRGDMSLVGPRPMMLDQAELYGFTAHYDAVRPGITGPWQVSSRNESEFTDRAVFDAGYRIGLSLRSDFVILMRTVGVVVRGTGY